MSYVKNSAGVLEIKDTNDYYPFGMNHLRETEAVYDPMSVPYNYKYSGKELQETGMYDFGARLYIPDLGRWGVIDPLAESTRRISTYNYALNNPISFIDPDGMKAYYAEPIDVNGIPEGSILFRTTWANYGSESGSAGGSGSVEKGGGGGDMNDEIQGVTKDDAKKLQQDIFSVLSNSKFDKLRGLIILKGKSLSSIDMKALEESLVGIQLSADERGNVSKLVISIILMLSY